MINKLMVALAAGLAAAALTKQQQSAFFNTVKDSGINITDINAETVINSGLPRGIRNNNPANIRYDGTQWQGLDYPPTDGSFARFTDVKYGIRAAARIIQSYQKRGIVTISQIISTWAPNNENNTIAYIDAVATDMDFLKDAVVPPEKIPDLIKAIIKHENGQQPYTLAAINNGVALA